MERLLEFVVNHYLLVSAFFLLLAMFFAIEVRRAGRPVSPQQATNLVNRENAVIVDVRSAEDFRDGHIAGSLNIPYADFEKRVSELEKYKDRPVIVTCRIGPQASAAGRILKRQGFNRLMRLQGGLQAWREEKLPVVKA